MSSVDTGIVDLFASNNLRKYKKRRKASLNLIESHPCCNSDVLKFIRNPKRIPKKDQQGLVLIVQSKDGRHLTKDEASKTPFILKDKICFGSLMSANDAKTMHQSFHCLSTDNYDTLSKEYKKGLKLQTNDIYQEVDCLLKSYSSGVYEALCIDKLAEAKSSYNHYARTFAGDGAPTPNDTFEVHKDLDDFLVFYKSVNARDYSEHSPMSMGFFSNKVHGVKILYDQSLLLLKSLGARGTYGGGRSVMKERGHLSYLFQRKCGTQRQPTIAEGPNDKSLQPEERYHYHRKTICHKWWPFAYKIMNFLVGTATTTAYYVYPHLAKFFPECNSPKYRQIFCPRGILALDFASSCHVDLNDLHEKYMDKIKTSLENVISGLEAMKTVDSSFILKKLAVAKNCLKHIMWWGVCSPTTCCYQYVKSRNDIVVYQWFLCPGLGTVHRIKNYWVHLFLAGTFSHCTSAAIYIVDDKAYFGKCPHVVMFSWGGN